MWLACVCVRESLAALLCLYFLVFPAFFSFLMTSPNFSVICVQSGFPSIPEHPRYQKGISYIDIHFSVFLSFRFDTKKANRLSDA